MTQYNPNPDCTTNTTGWSATSGVTLTATADGLRIQKAAGSGKFVYGPNFTITSSIKVGFAGWDFRRNTSTSGGMGQVTLEGFNTFTDWLYANLTYAAATAGASGTWISLPNSALSGSLSTSQDYYRFKIALPTAAVDFTIRNTYVYNETSMPVDPVALDSNDAGATFITPDSSITITAQHDNLNNEKVAAVRWDWGDGSAVTNQSITSEDARLPATTHAFPAAGIYTVSLTVLVNSGDTSGFTKTYTVTVPAGTFQAAFTYSASNLNVSVNGSTSVVPTYDSISSYTWVWGDGTANSTGMSASHTYDAPGTYNVSLTIRSSATLRESTVTQSIYVTLPPAPPGDYGPATKQALFSARLSMWDVDTFIDELPSPTEFTIAVPMDDMPSMTMRYSKGALRGDQVEDLVGQEYDLAFEIFDPNQGKFVEPEGCRFVIKNDTIDLMDPQKFYSMQGVGVADDLNAILNSNSLLNETGRVLKSVDGAITAGRIMGEFLGAEQTNYGFVLNWDFTAAKDSSAVPVNWSRNAGSTFTIPSDQTAMQVVQALVDLNLCHWTTQANELRLYDDASADFGRNLAFGGAGDVYLSPGKELTSIVTERSRRDYVSKLMIPTGSKGFWIRNSSSLSRRGRKGQRVSVGGDVSSADATIISDGIFATSDKISRSAYTCDLNLSNRLGDGVALPFVHYKPGDTVWAVGASGEFEPMIVQQITITGGAGKPLGGSVILNDRLVAQAINRVRASASALGGAQRGLLGSPDSTNPDDPIGSRVLTTTSGQSVANNTDVAVALNSSRALVGMTWDDTTKEFVIGRSGVYEMSGNVTFKPGATTGRCEAKIFKNGTAIAGSLRPFSATSDYQTVSADTTQALSTGDRIRLVARQNSGSTRTLHEGYWTWLDVNFQNP